MEAESKPEGPEPEPKPEPKLTFDEWKESIQLRAAQYGPRLTLLGIGLVTVFALICITTLLEPVSQAR